MEQSILLTIKKMLGLDKNYNAFDTDVLVNINTVFGILWQLGIGPENFFLTGETETWSDYLGDEKKLEMVKTLIYLRVKLLFDPPSSGVLHEAVERQIAELEWRLNLQAESEVLAGGE